eukprot:Skav207984  [mRNA]  locus=scaffold5707:17029:17304:- [translate_table: standard]
MGAARGGQEAVAKVLLENRADVVSATVDGLTALTFAARGGHQGVAKLLLEQGADGKFLITDNFGLAETTDSFGLAQLKLKILMAEAEDPEW